MLSFKVTPIDFIRDVIFGHKYSTKTHINIRKSTESKKNRKELIDEKKGRLSTHTFPTKQNQEKRSTF